MSKPAARLADAVTHPFPSVLSPGTSGSPNVFIGSQPAWRGLSAADVTALLDAVKNAQIAIAEAEAVTELATPGTLKAAAKVNEEKVKLEQQLKMASLIMGFAASGTDIHLCATFIPPPIHGPGVVINGSQTVLINGKPACRMGDMILEANLLANIIPNIITGGFPTVLIGG
jgi:uncharacterized Zn-binding protein involved in type VI secretion